ncbi:ferredoxin-fold anticodon-binding domain-containing protein 1-like isoform X2, partial [Dinothrombium tinctorium]
MKIDANRKLLREFFESVSFLCLDERTNVCVTLCAGQGGIPTDTKQRKFSDSWQVVNLATYGNFILHSVEPFKFLTKYSPSGFR